MSVLNLYKDAAFDDFINQWGDIVKIDKTKAKSIAKGIIKGETNENSLEELTKSWYESLAKGKPKYSVYGYKYYLSDVWACWCNYSRQYLLRIKKHDVLLGKSIIEYMTDVQVIVDVGCSFGYTTAVLKEFFPNASVYGTNIQKTTQWQLALNNSKKYNFTLLPNVIELQKIDLVFASEYFEHFQDPINHLKTILEKKPKYLLLANSFGTYSLGHFIFHKNNKEKIVAKGYSRFFNKFLKESGYKQIKTSCWNGKPALWEFNNEK